jgi:hypothetical protein
MDGAPRALLVAERRQGLTAQAHCGGIQLRWRSAHALSLGAAALRAALQAALCAGQSST